MTRPHLITLWLMVVSVISAGCSTGPSPVIATARNPTPPKAPRTEDAPSARELGARDATVSPRLADCSSHCAKMLDERRAAAPSQSEAWSTTYQQSCVNGCETQIRQKSAVPPPHRNIEAAKGRSQFLASGLTLSGAWCVRELQDSSEAGRKLLEAVDKASGSPAAIEAKQADETLLQLSQRTTPETLKLSAAQEHWLRTKRTHGARSPEANAARASLSDLRAAFSSTPLGRQIQQAEMDADVARKRAQNSAEWVAAMSAHGTWMLHRREVMRSATPAAAAQIESEMQACMDSWFDAQYGVD